MSYGLEVFDSTGTKVISSTDSLARLVYTQQIIANINGSVILPDIIGHDTIQLIFPLSNKDLFINVNRNNDTISWAWGYTAAYKERGLLVVFMIS